MLKTQQLAPDAALLKFGGLNEDLFRRVIESAPNGLMMINRLGVIVLCNNAFEQLFGYPRSEILGQTMEVLVPERFRSAHTGHRGRFFSQPEARQMGAGRDLFGLKKDGTEFPVEIGLNPLQTADGTYVLASIVDITMRKALESRLHHAISRLQQKNQEMEQFVYTVSHDLKSPLVTSSGFLGLLKEDLAAQRYSQLPDSVARLERANARMSQLIDDLLQLSRVGRLRLELSSVDVSELILSIRENLIDLIKQKGVTIETPSELPVVVADRERLYQVFENLVINALKYGSSNQNPIIRIGAIVADGETRFFVADNGPGIAKEYHEKIFGLFQRLENDKQGTGVGLTIVARVLQLHGGRAWIESNPDCGSTFWIAIPNQIPQGDSDNE